jgi:hypothetical protein
MLRPLQQTRGLLRITGACNGHGQRCGVTVSLRLSAGSTPRTANCGEPGSDLEALEFMPRVSRGNPWTSPAANLLDFRGDVHHLWELPVSAFTEKHSKLEQLDARAFWNECDRTDFGPVGPG